MLTLQLDGFKAPLPPRLAPKSILRLRALELRPRRCRAGVFRSGPYPPRRAVEADGGVGAGEGQERDAAEAARGRRGGASAHAQHHPGPARQRQGVREGAAVSGV